MMRLLLVFGLSGLSVFLMNFGFLEYHMRTSGSPGGNAGAPGQFNGRTCATSGCHSGGSSFRAGMIGSNIPASGYVPGQTYTITGTVMESGRSKFGFEITPQDSSGNLIGTLVRTNTAQTKIVNGGRSMTHTSSGSSGSGSMKSWSFDWTAPAAGSGDFAFWGAFNASNSNSSTSGDIILTSNLQVEEDRTGVGLRDEFTANIFIGPNPTQGDLRIRFMKPLDQKLDLLLIDLYGDEEFNRTLRKGSLEQVIDVENSDAGLYNLLLLDKHGEVLLSKKILVE